MSKIIYNVLSRDRDGIWFVNNPRRAGVLGSRMSGIECAILPRPRGRSFWICRILTAYLTRAVSGWVPMDPQKAAKRMSAENSTHLSLTEFFHRGDSSPLRIVEMTAFGGRPGPALCAQSCIVGLYGICPHGCPSSS
jgi:hypothetical protein